MSGIRPPGLYRKESRQSVEKEFQMSTISKSKQAINAAVIAVFWIGGGNLFIGILGLFRFSGGGIDIGISPWLVIGVGLAYLGLGFFVRQKKSIALAVAIVITIGLLLLTLVNFGQSIPSEGFPLGIGGSVLLLAFLVLMIKGYNAMRELESYPINK